MRFMVIVKANEDSEAGVMPTTEMLAEMGKYNEELVKAGVMLNGDGLHPSSKGVRVRFDGDKRTVTDGPFPETKELIAGFWIWQCDSLADAIDWLKRPHSMAEPNSKFARSSRRPTSARPSRPSFRSRKIASAPSSPHCSRSMLRSWKRGVAE